MIVIGVLMWKCDKVIVFLVLNVFEIKYGLDEYSMFKVSMEVYYVLLELVKLNGINVEEDKFFLENKWVKIELLVFLVNVWGYNKFMVFKEEFYNLSVY